MKCPKCNADLEENSTICPYCRYDSKLGQEEPKKRKKSKLPIVLLVIGIIFILIFSFIMLLKNVFKGIMNIIPDTNPVVDTASYTGLSLLKNDYESGKINVNEYFKQLVYLEYDEDSLDSKYKTDDVYEWRELGTIDVLEENYDKLDHDIVDFYLKNELLLNVTIGNTTTEPVQESSKDYIDNIIQLKDESANGIANHNLDKVYLSNNKRFIIWYTEQGPDAIKYETAKTIADNLEKAASSYESIYGIKYTYTPYYLDEELIHESVRELLSENNIPIAQLYQSMGVYVYNINADGTRGRYYNASHIARLIALSGGDIANKGKYVNYPGIVINQYGINNKYESTVQVVNHEMFHHFQWIYCNGVPELLDYEEGIANLSSALSTNVSAKNNDFLNTWSGMYTKKAQNKLSEIVDGGNQRGYGTFPYYYAYSRNNPQWVSVVLPAHKENNPYKYIQNNTSRDILIKTINDLSYMTLSNDYYGNSNLANSSNPIFAELKNGKENKYTSNAGSITHFEIAENSKLEIELKNKYQSINIYGYKDGKYTIIDSSSISKSYDSSTFTGYEKYYLSITNANLTKKYDYIINYIEGTLSPKDETKPSSSQKESKTYNTTFDNYNMEVIINANLGKVSLNSVSTGVMDERHQKQYLKTTVTTMGIDVETETYTDLATGVSYASKPYVKDGWMKSTDQTQMVDLGTILNRLTSMKNVKKVSSNHYKIKMTKSELAGIMKTANVSTFNGKSINVDVYVSNGYITKLEYDFGKVIGKGNTFTTVIKFSNYNNAGSVEIPSDVIEKATNPDKEVNLEDIDYEAILDKLM